MASSFMLSHKVRLLLAIFCLQDLAKKEHVNSVHLKLQAIARRVEAMQAENDYERLQVNNILGY